MKLRSRNIRIIKELQKTGNDSELHYDITDNYSDM